MHRWRCVLAAALLGTSGCVTIHYEHPSDPVTKSFGHRGTAVQDSFLYRVLPVLLDSQRGPEYFDVPLVGKKNLGYAFRQFIRRMAERHGKVLAEAALDEREQMATAVSADLILVVGREGVFRVEPVNLGARSHGEIVMDASVLRAILVAAIDDFLSLEAVPKADRDAFRTLVGYDGAATAPMTMARLKNLTSDEAATLLAASDLVERRFFGAMAYLLSHELGHLAYRHAVEDSRSCADFQTSELEADAYASAMTADAYMYLCVQHMGVQREVFFDAFRDYPGRPHIINGTSQFFNVAFINTAALEEFTNLAVFLEKGYRLAGFTFQSPNGCTYPPTEQRLQQSRDNQARALRTRGEHVAAEWAEREAARRSVDGLFGGWTSLLDALNDLQ